MINRYFILFGLAASIAHFSPAMAQPMPHLTGKLTVEEGLSSNTINDIVQDDNGFLWIATPEGLNRFDGTDVVQYFHNSDSNSLPHNFIYCLKKLPGNYLAIGTQEGLSFYNGKTGSFQNFYYRRNNNLDIHNNTIFGLTLDAAGNLWALSRNGIFVFDPQRRLKKMILSPFTEKAAARERLSFAEKLWPLSNGDNLVYCYNGWHIASAEKESLMGADDPTPGQRLPFLRRLPFVPIFSKTILDFPHARLFSVFGNFFLCIFPGSDSLVLLDEKGDHRSGCVFPYDKYPFISWSQQAVAIDSSTILLLLHNFGLLTVSVRWEKGVPVLTTTSSLLFASDEYQTALRDKQGNWWLATTREGLQKFSPAPSSFAGAALTDTRTRRSARYETMSCNRYGQTLWVSTYGDGFFGTDLLSGHMKQYRLKNTGNDLWANFVWNIRQVNKDTLWVGTQGGLFWYSLSSGRNGRFANGSENRGHGNGKPAVLDSVAITTQFTDSRGWTWMGLGKGKGVCYYDKNLRTFSWYPAGSEQGYPFRYPTNIAEGGDGGLWFVSDASNRLVHWDPVTRRFRIIVLPATAEKQIGYLKGICNEGDSVLWLGAITCGLVKYQLRTNTVTVYSHEKGLVNNHISSIYEDTAKRLWLVTEGGLACFDQHTGDFINYTTRNGLPVSYPTAAFFYDSLYGRIYTGGLGEYFGFYPANVRANQPPERVLITSMQVNGRPWLIGDQGIAQLQSQQNDITIRYAAIDMIDGPAIRYAYRLTGIDTGWLMTGRQRQINFSHLAPGTYTFQVRAVGNNGSWSS
ncbi:MAG TPA: two-component regulator propeller domain-containing protein, partial [Puia sp.]|nr:two-component regulator propeller domain-containing protein [Puia sp.]